MKSMKKILAFAISGIVLSSGTAFASITGGGLCLDGCGSGGMQDTEAQDLSWDPARVKIKNCTKPSYGARANSPLLKEDGTFFTSSSVGWRPGTPSYQLAAKEYLLLCPYNKNDIFKLETYQGQGYIMPPDSEAEIKCHTEDACKIKAGFMSLAEMRMSTKMINFLQLVTFNPFDPKAYIQAGISNAMEDELPALLCEMLPSENIQKDNKGTDNYDMYHKNWGTDQVKTDDNCYDAFGYQATGGGSLPLGEYITLESHSDQNQCFQHSNFLGHLKDCNKFAGTQQFKVVPGLAGGGISLESKDQKGYFLRHQGYEMKLHKFEKNDLYKADATFIVDKGFSDSSKVSLRSVNKDGQYIRSSNGRFYIDYIFNEADKDEATFDVLKLDQITNVAIGKNTSMSSGAYNNNDDAQAKNAVDGSLATGMAHTSVAASGQWWQVDLGAPHDLTSSRWFNRNDTWGSRMNNYTVKVSLDAINWTNISEQKTRMGQPTTIAIDATARYVRLVQNNNDFINFSEVEIDGSPVPEQKALTSAVKVGQVKVKQKVRAMWTSVDFDQAFAEAPIVIASPISQEGGDPAIPVVRNVTAQGFEVQLKEWDYLDGEHADVTIDYLAVIPGTHNFNDLKINAKSVNVDHNFKTVNFDGAFTSAPSVFTQLQTGDVVYQSATPRMRNVATNSVDVSLQEQQAHDGIHAVERVNVVSFSNGSTTIDGKRIIVGKTDIDHNAKTINFGLDFGAPLVFSSIETFNGGDTAAMRKGTLTSTSVELKVEEEQSLDDEVEHATEKASMLIIGR